MLNTDTFNAPLKLDALGLWLYLLSKPDHWEVSTSQLSKHFRVSRDKIYRIFAELEAYGVLVRDQTRDKGTFGGIAYTVYETPQTENPSTVNSSTESTDSDENVSKNSTPANSESVSPQTENPSTVENSTASAVNGANVSENPPQTGLPETEKPCPENSTLEITDFKKLLTERERRARAHDSLPRVFTTLHAGTGEPIGVASSYPPDDLQIPTLLERDIRSHCPDVDYGLALEQFKSIAFKPPPNGNWPRRFKQFAIELQASGKCPKRSTTKQSHGVEL